MIPTIKELRESAGGLSGLTDEEIVGAVYPQFQRYYPKPDEFAGKMGYGGSGRGLTSSRISAGVDSYQANLYGVAEAVTDAEWAKHGREENEQAAAYANRRAKELGGIDSYKDVDGIGSGLNYLGGLTAQSLPYVGEALIGGLTGGLSSVVGAGARMGLSRAVMRTAGGVAASYPSAVGDILSNQRDQSGTTDLLSASVLAAPYAALNAFGVEGALARRQGFRSMGRALDDASGLSGAAMRTAATTGRMGLVEGFAETSQEGLNQLGRMAVDPNETFFNDKSIDRFGESFVGGAALGGAMGGVAGGWRRSEAYQADLAKRAAEAEQGQTSDLLSPMPEFALQSYGQGDGPAYRTSAPMQDAPLDQQVPGQREMFYPNGEATYAADAGGDAPLLSAYDAATQRAGVARTRLGNPDGLDQDAPVAGNIDRLELPPQVLQTVYEQAARKADAGQPLTPFETKVLNTYSTRPNPQAQLDVAPERGQFKLDGGPTPQFDNTPVEPRPDFELTAQDANPTQGELDLRDPAEHPIVRQLADERKGQRGVTQQLAFNAETASPKGQVLMGLADSLLGEQHLDESTHVQVSTMIAQSKFAAAKKVLDEALKEKAAADALIAKVEKLAEKDADAQQTKVDKGTSPASLQAPANTPASGVPAAAGTATSAPVTPSEPVVDNQPGDSAVAQEPRDYAQAVKSLPAAEKKKAKALMGRIDRMEQLIKCLKNQRVA